MVRLLGNDAHLVSYGAMAKQPLSIPTSTFIFKNLTCHGFWQRQWYHTRPREERDAVMQNLVTLIKEKKVKVENLGLFCVHSSVSYVA
jgi:NADPH:quinone reductase-like Zn-dependent oxidoreductase